MSNVIDNETGRPLADGKVHHIIEWGGRKIGLIGLVEREWLDTLATINPEEVDYTDYVDAGSMLAAELKKKGEDCESGKIYQKLFFLNLSVKKVKKRVMNKHI